MNELTEMQINLIRGDLRREGIEMNELEDDLLDHICCAMEEEMHLYASFEVAYEKIKQEFCPDGYREIQQETTQLLTIKYSKMKKLTNAVGIAGAAMVVTGSAFKFAHWPFANILLVLGTGILAFFYLPMMLGISLQQTDRMIGKVRNAVGYLSGTALLTGLLFKTLHWPGATIISLLAIAVFLVVFLPLFLSTTGKGTAFEISPVATTVLIIVSSCVLFSFAGPKSSSSFHRAIESFNQTLDVSLESNFARLKELRQAKSNESNALAAQTDALVAYATALKSGLLEQLEVEGDQLPERLAMSYQVRVTNPTFKNANGNFAFNGPGLQEKVEAVFTAANAKNAKVAPILEAQSQDWMEKYFLDQPLFVIFDHLTLLQLEATQIEMALLGAA